MLGFDALAKVPLATASSASGGSLTLSATQDNNTVAATAIVRVAASFAQTQAGNTINAGGAVAVKALADVAQAGNTVSAASAVQLKATLSATQDQNTVSAAALAIVSGSLSKTQGEDTATGSVMVSDGPVADFSAAIVQAGDSLSASAGVLVSGSGAGSQESQTVSAAAIGRLNAALNILQADNVVVPPDVVVAPSYGYWLKTQEKKKPKPPKLPDPVQPGEVVVDEAVLLQMEEERLAALVLKAKQDALRRVEELRGYAPSEPRPTKSVTIDPRRFDVVETAPEIRTRVVTLFRPPSPEPLKELVPNYTPLRALGPRHLPQPDIRKARTISLRRASSRSMQTGLTQHG